MVALGPDESQAVLMVCRRCGLVLQFSAGRSIFDFACGGAGVSLI